MIVVELVRVHAGQRRAPDYLEFATIEHALAWAAERYRGCRREPEYVDTKSRGTIQCGWIYSVKGEGQHWVSFHEEVAPRELKSINIVSSDARKICRAFDAADERDSTEIGI